MSHDELQFSLSIFFDDSFTMKELNIFKLVSSSLQQIKFNAINENIFYKITNRFSVENISVITLNKTFNIIEKFSRFVIVVNTVKSLNVIILKNKFRDVCCVNCVIYYFLYS